MTLWSSIYYETTKTKLVFKMNFVEILFVCFSVAIAIGGFIQIFQRQTPQIFQDLLLYGKVRGERKKKTIIRNLEVPKRLYNIRNTWRDLPVGDCLLFILLVFVGWFLHMYVAGIIVNVPLFLLVIYAYQYGDLPQNVDGFWNILQPSDRFINIDQSTVMLMFICIIIQVTRRLLECFFVHIFSKSSAMNVFHYGMGIIFYSMLGVGVLHEAPQPGHIKGFALNKFHVAGLTMFAWASYQHFRAHNIFAKLRKTKDGRKVSEKHMIAHGGWFEYVSCPHYLMEILIYTSFMLIQGFQNRTFGCIYLFVIVNQTVIAYVTHLWYIKTFSKYPAKRKAVIPFIL